MTARFIANKIKLSKQTVRVYATPKISHALTGLLTDLGLYEGVKLVQVMEALYTQGQKDGAQAAFETMSAKFAEAQKEIPHKKPGRPKKAKKKT